VQHQHQLCEGCILQTRLAFLKVAGSSALESKDQAAHERVLLMHEQIRAGMYALYNRLHLHVPSEAITGRKKRRLTGIGCKQVPAGWSFPRPTLLGYLYPRWTLSTSFPQVLIIPSPVQRRLVDYSLFHNFTH